MRHHKKPIDSTPSKLLTQFAKEIVTESSGPIVDVGSGYGRNAIYLASFGAKVLCIDNNIEALNFIKNTNIDLYRAKNGVNNIETIELDLIIEKWPFKAESLGAIISVHFLPEKLLDYFIRSLKKGGYLFIETIGGQGGNYLQLPPKGFIINKISDLFEIKYFKERKVGPIQSEVASVKLFAKKNKSLYQ